MLSITNLEKYFGERCLFDKANMVLSPREKLAFIGRNGQGKSTLFKIILGEMEHDNGVLSISKNYRIAHLSQHVSFSQKTVVEEASLRLQNEHEVYKAEKILMGLGLDENQFHISPHQLSSGYKLRLELAKILASEPNLLLLDEPTNYLDIISTRWLSKFLSEFPGEVIVISHDRSFLDSFNTHSMILHRHQLKKQKGKLSTLLEQVAMEEEIYEKTRMNQERKIGEIENFISRFRAKASKAKQVQSRVKSLEKTDVLSKREELGALQINFQFPELQSKNFYWGKDLSFSYEKGQPLIQDLNFEIKKGERLGVIGKNGKGKTTLLKMIKGDLKGGGEVYTHPKLRISYFGQDSINELFDNHTIEEEIRLSNPAMAHSRIRAICGAMMFSDEDALKKVKVLSGGEKARVVLGKIMASPAHLILLDEPTNHLDVESIDILIECLNYFEGAIVFVSHDEDFIHKLGERLIVFTQDETRIFDHNYSYFLEKIGWDEGSSSSKSKKPKLSKKEYTRVRQEIIREKSKELKPVKEELAIKEAELIQCEGLVDELMGLLTSISTGEKEGDIQEASIRLGKEEKLRDSLYERIEELMLQEEELNTRYDEKLDELEN